MIMWIRTTSVEAIVNHPIALGGTQNIKENYNEC